CWCVPLAALGLHPNAQPARVGEAVRRVMAARAGEPAIGGKAGIEEQFSPESDGSRVERVMRCRCLRPRARVGGVRCRTGSGLGLGANVNYQNSDDETFCPSPADLEKRSHSTVLMYLILRKPATAANVVTDRYVRIHAHPRQSAGGFCSGFANCHLLIANCFFITSCVRLRSPICAYRD